MELTLNVYGKTNEVVKTYTANDFTLKTGLCEDIMNMVDVDKLTSLSQEKMGIEVIKIVAKSFSKFKPFLQDVFDGLTDEEYKNTSIKEVGLVIFAIVRFTISELSSISENKKK